MTLLMPPRKRNDNDPIISSLKNNITINVKYWKENKKTLFAIINKKNKIQTVINKHLDLIHEPQQPKNVRTKLRTPTPINKESALKPAWFGNKVA